MRPARLRQRADRHAGEAWAARGRLILHSARATHLLRRRLGSPAGLAVAFSLGFISGSPALTRGAAGAAAGGGDARPMADRLGRLAVALAARTLVAAAKAA